MMKTYLLSLVLLLLGANTFCVMASADKQKQYAPAFLQEALKAVVTRGQAEGDVKPQTLEKQKQCAPAGLQKVLEQQKN